MRFPRQLYTPQGEVIKVKLVAKMENLGTYADGVIRIRKDLKGDLRWSVLLHEILHFCWERANHDELKDSFEERCIERLEMPLYDILRANFRFGPGSD